MSRLDLTPDNQFAAQIKKMAEDISQIKNDQLIKAFRFNIADKGEAIVNIPIGYGAGTYDITIPHVLEIYPIVDSYVTPPYSLPTDKYVLDNPAISSVSGVVKWLTYTTIGIDYVTFTVDLQATGMTWLQGNWVFKYFLLEEAADQ